MISLRRKARYEAELLLLSLRVDNHFLFFAIECRYGYSKFGNQYLDLLRSYRDGFVMAGDRESCIIRTTPGSRLSGSIDRRRHYVAEEGPCGSCQLFLEHGMPSAASGCGFFVMSLCPVEPALRVLLPP